MNRPHSFGISLPLYLNHEQLTSATVLPTGEPIMFYFVVQKFGAHHTCCQAARSCITHLMTAQEPQYHRTSSGVHLFSLGFLLKPRFPWGTFGLSKITPGLSYPPPRHSVIRWKRGWLCSCSGCLCFLPERFFFFPPRNEDLQLLLDGGIYEEGVTRVIL